MLDHVILRVHFSRCTKTAVLHVCIHGLKHCINKNKQTKTTLIQQHKQCPNYFIQQNDWRLFAGYEANPAYMGAICGRVANRIDGAKFTMDGKTYTVSKNDPLGDNFCHGGFIGLTRVMSSVWMARKAFHTFLLSIWRYGQRMNHNSCSGSLSEQGPCNGSVVSRSKGWIVFFSFFFSESTVSERARCELNIFDKYFFFSSLKLIMSMTYIFYILAIVQIHNHVRVIFTTALDMA